MRCGALASGLILFAATAVAAPPEALRVGLDPRSPPWSFLPGNHDTSLAPGLEPEQITRLQGIDIDVIRALEQRMGVHMQIVTTRWKDLEAELLQGRFDLIINAWTPSVNTPPGIAASTPYYDWGLLVAARASDASIRSVADLGQKRIGHFPDPAVLPALRAMGLGLGAELNAVGSETSGVEVFQKLGRGAWDAVIYDSAFVRWQVARDPRFKVVGQPLNRLGYHVGVRQADTALLARVEAAVRAFVASPEAEGVRRRWERAGAPAP
jgi:polar amino acid transport system substrate-binding protein